MERNAVDGTALTQAWYDGQYSFFCNMTGCNQTVSDTVVWECQDIGCTCIAGTTLCTGPLSLGSTVPTIAGVTIVTFQGNGQSEGNIEFETLSIIEGGLAMSCVSGECAPAILDPGYVFAAASNELTVGEIAGIAVVGAAVFTIFSLLLACFVRQRHLRKKSLPEAANGMTLSYSNISYEVAGKKILHGVSGSARPGRVLAILGPSGTDCRY